MKKELKIGENMLMKKRMSEIASALIGDIEVTKDADGNALLKIPGEVQGIFELFVSEMEMEEDLSMINKREYQKKKMDRLNGKHDFREVESE